MINAGTRITALALAERCAKSALFKEEYDSYMKGKPFDYTILENAAYYERGRIFAIFTQQTKSPRATWRQGILAKTARERIIQSVNDGYMR